MVGIAFVRDDSPPASSPREKTKDASLMPNTALEVAVGEDVIPFAALVTNGGELRELPHPVAGTCTRNENVFFPFFFSFLAETTA